MANALAAKGVKPGDRVTAQVEKSLPNAVLYLACLKAGAIYNPMNSGYTSAELDYFIADAEPSVLVCQTAALGLLAPIAKAHEVAATLLLEPDGSGSLSDLAALLYTSGTTGRSKGAMITHGNLSSNAAALERFPLDLNQRKALQSFVCRICLTPNRCPLWWKML